MLKYSIYSNSWNQTDLMECGMISVLTCVIKHGMTMNYSVANMHNVTVVSRYLSICIHVTQMYELIEKLGAQSLM